MQTGRRVGRTAMGLIVATAAGFAASAAELPVFEVRDIGTLGGPETIGYDLNGRGQVTGDSLIDDSRSRAFLYSDGVLLDLGTLGGRQSFGTALNDAGDVTGQADDGEGRAHAFLYSGGAMHDIGTIGGTFSSGNDVNDAGQVTGISTTTDGAFHPFLFAGGELLDLGTPGGRYSVGLSINGKGDVAGYYDRQFETRAFLYANGALHDLVSSGFSRVQPYAQAVNSAGHVTGTYRPAGANRAFLYRDGSAIDLGTLGGEWSDGYALNDASEVTGSSTTADGDSHAFLYTGGAMRDLGTLGGRFSIGYAINASGDVVGNSTDAAGLVSAFVYRKGKMLALDLGAFDAVESGSRDINDAGQVLGWYTTPRDGILRMRTFLATPIALLLGRLVARADSAGPGRSLAAKARTAADRYAAEDLRGSCRALDEFVRAVRTAAGTRHLDGGEGDVLRADARAIGAALDCDAGA